MVANPLLLCGALRFEKKHLLFSNVSVLLKRNLARLTAAVISTRVNEMGHVSQINLPKQFDQPWKRLHVQITSDPIHEIAGKVFTAGERKRSSWRPRERCANASVRKSVATKSEPISDYFRHRSSVLIV
jgi:hypothetical protein